MCPARTELAYRTVCRAAYSRSLCRHSHLVVHDAEHRCLQHLRFDQRTFHYDDRLVREYDLSLSHRIDVACEFHCGQVISVVLVFLAGKEPVEEVRVHVSEVADHLKYLVDAADHSPVVVFRGLSVEQVEHSVLVLHAAVIKRLSHRVLVLVRAICNVKHV